MWNGWADAAMPLDGRIARLFDALELPASSLALTDPLWCVLAAGGLVPALRGRLCPGSRALLAGLCLAPALMLTAWYMAFRYRVEFTPPLMLLACLGLARLARQLEPSGLARARFALLCLAGLQVVSAAAAGLRYRDAPFGPSPGHVAVSLLEDR